ncbi:group II intron reverse transcriptase/maturase, partial [Planctomycetota bacterium]
MENITLTKLALISERARREPQFQFTSLAHLLNEGFLKGCYYSLGRDRASGIDGVSWKEYGEQLDENLSHLVARMKAKRYHPQPAKRVYIPKNEHEKRPLGLPALEDKIVQKGIARILEAIYEADFLDCSYGFRPERNCHQALNVVDKTIMTRPVSYVIEADIKGYFDNVSHQWLMEFLQFRIKDPSFLLLIRRFLKAGYCEAGLVVATEQGTPQGGNLSPMLSNIFLHYVLDLWFEKKVKLRSRGACQLVRYADDFICMVQYADEAQHLEQALRERFAQFDLELHPEKTRVISFGRYERQNAQRQNRKTNTF